MKNVLDFAVKLNIKTFVYLSSVEVYGHPLKEQTEFKEEMLGFLDLNNPRSIYPESKRISELMCKAYNTENHLNYLILRPSKTFGITFTNDDKRATAEFLRCSAKGKDIVLRTKGAQCFSFCYNADLVSAILHLLIKGKGGNAYNISSKNSNASIFEFANICAKYGNSKIVIDENNNLGFSTFNHTIINTEKLKATGFIPHYDLDEAVRMSIDILKEDSN